MVKISDDCYTPIISHSVIVTTFKKRELSEAIAAVKLVGLTGSSSICVAAPKYFSVEQDVKVVPSNTDDPDHV